MKKILKVLVFALAVITVFGAFSSTAFKSYETYTYSIDGEPLQCPTAYRPTEVADAFSMKLADISPEGMSSFDGACDIVTDNEGNVYVADKNHNRIVVLDKYYVAKDIISTYVDEFGYSQRLSSPEGVFVTNPDLTSDGSSYVYVCDTGNRRIVIFDRDYNYVKTIDKPDTPLLTAESFAPQRIAVDIYGRIFIATTATHEGAIVLSDNGDFTGFIGAQRVTYSFIEMIWRRFQTDAQKDAQIARLAIPYSDITVDDEGFVYVITNSTEASDKKTQFAAIKSKSAAGSPVKKLNSAGDEIMKRNGFFDPGGEVAVTSTTVSQIVDVAVGKEGSWSILDKSRSRVFTYDQNGNLLFAFGDKGDQLGNGSEFVSMAYQVVDGVYYLLLLDNTDYKITSYAPTDYYETIISALRNANEHNYSESIFFWQDVLTQNNNFDLAYIGIGKALFNQGKYKQAQEMLSAAYETKYHDKAFVEIRKSIIQKALLPILIVAIVLIVLVLKFLGYAKKVNKAVSLKPGKKTYWEELLYAFHLVFHPFDGFWDLKHEKRGSVRASLTIMLITIASFFYQAIGQGYSFNPKGDYSTVAVQVIAVAVPVFLWCIGNWCLTTLFDGEGSFKDIFIATGYSLAPLPIFVIVSTILTNVMTAGEGSMVGLIVGIGYVWVGFLLFFGMMITHDYTMGKNFITTLGSIVAMAIIIFIIVLFSSLVAKMLGFIIAIFSEIRSRT
ncbi:MAG: YIP1 family protein [Clostridia bacterium]|nr:YIP1 family protein [Clostridia bacterium]